MMRGILDWNGVGALLLCNQPLLVLLRIGVTVGAGHFNQLEVPEQITSMMDRFVRIAT